MYSRRRKRNRISFFTCDVIFKLRSYCREFLCDKIVDGYSNDIGEMKSFY